MSEDKTALEKLLGKLYSDETAEKLSFFEIVTGDACTRANGELEEYKFEEKETFEAVKDKLDNKSKPAVEKTCQYIEEFLTDNGVNEANVQNHPLAAAIDHITIIATKLYVDGKNNQKHKTFESFRKDKLKSTYSIPEHIFEVKNGRGWEKIKPLQELIHVQDLKTAADELMKNEGNALTPEDKNNLHVAAIKVGREQFAEATQKFTDDYIDFFIGKIIEQELANERDSETKTIGYDSIRRNYDAFFTALNDLGVTWLTKERKRQLKERIIKDTYKESGLDISDTLIEFNDSDEIIFKKEDFPQLWEEKKDESDQITYTDKKYSLKEKIVSGLKKVAILTIIGAIEFGGLFFGYKLHEYLNRKPLIDKAAQHKWLNYENQKLTVQILGKPINYDVKDSDIADLTKSLKGRETPMSVYSATERFYDDKIRQERKNMIINGGN